MVTKMNNNEFEYPTNVGMRMNKVSSSIRKEKSKMLDKNYIVNTNIQPGDTKRILKHLDSLMTCITNAYNTSGELLQSDMIFIEKQEKAIKEIFNDKI